MVRSNSCIFRAIGISIALVELEEFKKELHICSGRSYATTTVKIPRVATSNRFIMEVVVAKSILVRNRGKFDHEKEDIL